MQKPKQIFFDEFGLRKYLILISLIFIFSIGLFFLTNKSSFDDIFGNFGFNFLPGFLESYSEMVVLGVIGLSLLNQFLIMGIVLGSFAYDLYYKTSMNQYFVKQRYTPLVSVIVPCYNEEKVILKNLQSLLAVDYANLEIIVVDDGSKDGTLNLLIENYLKNPKVRIIAKANGGKASALNYGISKSISEVVVCVDADTVILKDSIKQLVKHFTDPQVAAVAGNVRIGNGVNFLVWFQELEYLIGQNFDKIALSFVNSVTVVPGAIGAWRKSFLNEVGGYEENTLVEDADLTLTMIEKGYKVIYEPKAKCFTESPETWNAFFKQRNRWQLGTLQVLTKHKELLFSPKNIFFGFIVLPMIIINFLFVYPLTLYSFYFLVTNLIFRLAFTLDQFILLIALGIVLIIKFGVSLAVESIYKAKWKLFVSLPFYLEIYVNIVAMINIYAILRAFWGVNPSWNHLQRTGNVHLVPAAKF